MKQLLLFLLITAPALAQNNFKFENVLVWQNVYEQTEAIEDYNINLKKLGFESYIEDGIINFSRSFSTEDLRPHGYKTMSYPVYIGNGGFYKGIIEFKEDAYRVTITQIQVNDGAGGNVEDLSLYVTKNKAIRQQSNHQKTLDVLNLYFTEVFKKSTLKW